MAPGLQAHRLQGYPEITNKWKMPRLTMIRRKQRKAVKSGALAAALPFARAIAHDVGSLTASLTKTCPLIGRFLRDQ